MDHTAGDRVDRAAVQREVQRRGDADRAHATVTVTTPIGAAIDVDADAGAGGADAPLRKVPLFTVPLTTSRRPLARLAKRVVHKSAYWLIAPVVDQLNDLRTAAILSVARAEHQHRAPDRHVLPGEPRARH